MSHKSTYTTKEQHNALKCRKRGICLACGQTPIPKRRRRYCSDKCKKRLDFALYIATGLVQTLRARYAAFSYTEDTLILDILPVGANVISRFVWERSKSKNVADDLLDMVEQAGCEWYSKTGMQYIRSAYRRKAMLYHPDKGDTSNKFIEINEAHAELLNWAENPTFYSRTALANSWCYDASRKRWVPPA